LLDALQDSRTLLVLWSRNAASSSYMQREWRLVPPACNVIPVRLDSCPLPEDLAHFQGLDGFGISGRILSRTLELTREQKLSGTEANQVILKELEEEGIELEPKQQKALLGFATLTAASSLLLALREIRYLTGQLGRSLLTAKGGAALLGASLFFGAGFLSAKPGDAHATPAISPPATVESLQPDLSGETAACSTLLDECRRRAPAATTASSARACPPVPADKTQALRKDVAELERTVKLKEEELRAKEQELKRCVAASKPPPRASATNTSGGTATSTGAIAPINGVASKELMKARVPTGPTATTAEPASTLH
jgi:hypothetical protein